MLQSHVDYRVIIKKSKRETRTYTLPENYKRYRGDVIPIVIDVLRTIAEDGQNREKNPLDLRRLDITQTPVNDRQLTL